MAICKHCKINYTKECTCKGFKADLKDNYKPEEDYNNTAEREYYEH